ncbi:cell wall-active antibiotic response 4TMS protein YvqF [Stackebrandtia albiflava]|uniref:Cell wall-active antibiotic response 4TMS protein YvqF n=1 Tax=Stackebrandtia albiflava TaxID=406432 RepID=A0A562V3L7_9ACTN|nr:DUF1707 domain-containing protein [Stackebrandtia albiflava]TWJ12480.1 cell wall-active antibiotic response 4TMS protein YvqF [Stackebrandtia albiflava]
MAESTPIDPTRLRVSDADREAVVARLQAAASEGRLTLGEFSERADQVYQSRTRGELDRLTVDLPSAAGPVAETHTGFGRGAEVARSEESRVVRAIMGDNEDRLVGRIPERLRVLAVMGDVTLDLREAVLTGGEVEVTGHVVMGSVRVIVPNGIEVRQHGSNVMGDVRTRLSHNGGGAAPVVRIKLVNVMGEVKIVDDAHHKPLRRRLSQWWGHD